MSTRHKLLMVLAMIHLGLAAFGAAMIPLGDPQRPSLLTRYRRVTGTDNSFSFFAPGVGPQERLTLVMQDERGEQWEESLRIGPNHEANMCFETVSFVLAATDDTTAWNMLQSVCETMMGRHPTAVKVTARVETYAAVWNAENADARYIDFPRIREFAEGKRPQWLLKYEVSFPNSLDAVSLDRKSESHQL